MIVSKSEMDAMHVIQVNIFKHVIDVCEKLGLSYILVHGSLLGAERTGHIVPLDDDIDIAMPRVDYERFITEGSRIINNQFFIQSCRTDKDYPLEFAKVRDSNTTYIAEPCRNIDMHHGVFIDVFPIDFVEENYLHRQISGFIKKVLSVRVGCVFSFSEETLKQRIFRTMSKILIPSWKSATQMREKWNKRLTEGKYVTVTGGKPTERKIPAAWFSAIEYVEFEGVQCAVPCKRHEYLSLIYGDYSKRTLLEDKEHDENCVEINAILLDLEKSYKEYR